MTLLNLSLNYERSFGDYYNYSSRTVRK